MNDEPGKKTGIPHRFHNWISLGGIVVAIGSMFSFVLLFALEMFASHGNPYLGILTYVVSPAFFFLGVFLVLLGAWIQRRHTPAVARHPIAHRTERPSSWQAQLRQAIQASSFILSHSCRLAVYYNQHICARFP